MQTKYLKTALIALTVAGVVIPYYAFIPFLIEHGFNLQLFAKEAFATRIASFAWLDVIVSAVVILLAAFSGKFITQKQAVLVTIFTLCAGGSAGLPLLLYFMLDKPKLLTALK